ncbi:MAG TPA: alpha/beta fold hydrolase [Candidatus Limnocylindrales bacterium]|nr:alpha/beta fold hydrolase [Candidatus Limnocylindrales bacterium]
MIGALLRAIGQVLGLITGAYLAYVAARGSRILTRPEVRPFLPEYEGAPVTPGDLGLDYEAVRFTCDDGVTLSAWLVPAGRETRTAVIILHGFSGHRLPELAAFVPWLQERHHVLQFDFRGHGESDPGIVTLGSHERQDVAAAVRFLESRGLGPIALFGVSMGASTAIVAAPELRVAAVVADAPFAELHHPVANRMREAGYPMAAVGARAIVLAAALRTRSWLRDPISAVSHIAPRPLLIISPAEDRLIHRTQSERLFERAGEPKELFRVPNAGHAEAYTIDPEAYRSRVLGFLERHLG